MSNKPQPRPPENQTKGDDRNIVALDSAYEGASFEDKLYLFWNDYQRVILGLVALAIIVLAGWGIITLVQDRREARIASEFQAAATIDEKFAFAERHASHPAAGAAFLEVADHQFGEGDYAEAAANYRRAAESLNDLPNAGRARIGHGVALALAGQPAEAMAALEQVARNTGNYDIIRAEAHYHAATLAIELGEYETARSHIDSVLEVDRSQMWASRAMGLSQMLPERS